MSPTPAPAPEEILWEGHPSYWNWWPSVVFADVCAVAGLALGLNHFATPFVAGALGLGAVVHLSVWARRKGSLYRLTSQRAIMRLGFLARRESDVELRDIRSINLKQTLRQRLAGLGDVEISSAAGEGIEVTFQGIARADKVKEAVRQARIAVGAPRMSTDRVVYSSDPAFCAACGKSPCVCAQRLPGKARQPDPVRLSFQRGGKGSGVTRIEGIVLHPRLKEELLQKFKKRFGCGGTIKDGTLEVQGDRRDIVETELKAEGYRIKRIGG